MEQIKITNVTRKQMPSKYQEGQFYTLTTIIDDKGREMTGSGKWTEGWQIGQTIDVNVVQGQWTDKDGFPHVSLKLENPNPAAAGGQGGKKFYPQRSKMVDFYTLAIQMLPLFKTSSPITLDYVHDLAMAIKKKIDVVENAAPAQTEAAGVTPKATPAPAQPVEEVIEIEEDIKPF